MQEMLLSLIQVDGAGSGAMITGIVCVAFFLFRLMDRMLSRGKDERIEAILVLSQKTWDIHNSYDNDGAPKWYTVKSDKKLDLVIEQNQQLQKQVNRMQAEINILRRDLGD